MDKKTHAPTDQPERVHCKGGTKSARLVFAARAKCQDFVARYKQDGFQYTISSPFCNTTSTILVRESKSQEFWEIGTRFAPLWNFLEEKLRTIFPEHDSEGPFLVPTIDFRAQALNVFDRRYHVEMPVLRFVPVGDDHGYCFSLDMSVPRMPADILQQIIDEANAEAKDPTLLV